MGKGGEKGKGEGKGSKGKGDEEEEKGDKGGKGGEKGGKSGEKGGKDKGGKDAAESKGGDKGKAEKGSKNAGKGGSKGKLPDPGSLMDEETAEDIKGDLKGKGKGKIKGKLQEVLEGEEPPVAEADFEDTLMEVLQERRRAMYPELQVRYVFDAVDDALNPHYEGLVRRYAGRIRDFEGKCVSDEKQHKAWIKDRYELGQEVEGLEKKVREERERANQFSTVAANNSLRLMTGKSIPKGQLNAIKMVGAGGLDVNVQHLEKDIGKLDIDIGTTRFKTLQSIINSIYWRLPQTRDITYIASHYGESCGAFFRFHSTLLLISVITLACYSPLLVMQLIDYWSLLGVNWCGSSTYFSLPCEFLFGGFRAANSTMAENWTTLLDVGVVNSEQVLQSAVSASTFNSMHEGCPVLRHIRDCRVHSVYAGFNTSTSSYDHFTSSWSDSPHTINQDYVIFANYPDLLNSNQAWECASSTVSDVGYPSNCGVVYGSFGDPRAHEEWFVIPGNGSTISGISFGASLQVFSGSTCPVARKEDIEDLALGRKRTTQPSGRDVFLALRYFGCTFGGATLVAIFVLIRWRAAEVTFSIERLNAEVSPIRWSRWVLGLWDFRLRTDEEKELWKQALANLLRAEYEEETYQQREGNKTGWQRWYITFKRLTGATLNVAVIFGSWVAIAYSIVEKTTIQVFLEGITDQEPLRSILATVGAFAPNLVIAAVGQVLPTITKTLTQFEAWDPASRARHNLWRLFVGKVLNATVFIALNIELLNDKPMIMKSRFLATRDCVNFACAEDQAAMQVMSLTNSELVVSMLKPFTKLIKAVLIHSSGISRLCRRSDEDKKKHRFQWPMFDIAEAAVDTVYLQLLIWFSQLLVPFIAMLTPFVLWFHFKWLSLQLRFLTSRPFVSDSSRLRVALQRVLCCGAMLYCMGVLFFLNTSFPHESNCGPFDSHQAPGHMIFDLTFSFKTYLEETMEFVIRIWLLIFMILVFGVLMLVLRMIMAGRTNFKVLETMAATSARQVDALQKEMIRMEHKAEIYKKRIEWIEKYHKNQK